MAEPHLDPDSELTASSTVELQRLDDGTTLDRAHAVRLPGDAALGVRDGLGRATLEGIRLTRRARAGEVYRLVPPKNLAEGIRSENAASRDARARRCVGAHQGRQKRRIAGKSDLKRVKPNALKVLGPAAWQAMALATQQHYLVEISGKLDNLQRGIDEVLARLTDAQHGTLRHLREKADDVLAALSRGEPISASRVADLRASADSAKKLWHQLARTAERQLGEYRDGTRSAHEVEESFAMLAQATQVLAHCSDALMAVPYGTDAELEQAFAEERDRMLPALPNFRDLVTELLEASAEWNERHADYEQRRLKHPAPRLVNAIKPLPHIGQRKPVQEPLDDEARWRYRRLAPFEQTGPPQLLVEVLDNGDVLMGRDGAEGV
jgi:hypothetical protein